MSDNRPLLGPAAAFAAGVGAGFSFTGSPAAVGLALAFAGVAGAVALERRRAGGAALALSLAFFGGGLVAAATSERPTPSAVVDAAARAGEPVDLEADVLEAPQSGPEGARVRLRAVGVARVTPGTPAPLEPARFLGVLTLRGPEKPWDGVALPEAGDRIRLRAKLAPPTPPHNPGEPDRALRAARAGIAYVGGADLATLSVLRPGAGWPARFGRWRRRFLARAAALCTTPDRASVVSAMAVGERSAVSEAVDDDFNATGLAHLLAISGLHLAVAVLLLYRLLKWLLSRSEAVALRVTPARAAAAIALPLTALYVVFIGAPMPAVRAGIGAAFFLGGVALGRESDALNALAAAALAILALEPPALFEPAFQLSFAGMLGLLVLGPPLRDLVPKRGAGDRRPRRAAIALAHFAITSLTVAIATAPLTAVYFHRASLVGVAANLVAFVPGAALVPLAKLALLADAVSPRLSLVPFWLADLGAGALLAVARAFAALPFADVRLGAPTPLDAALWWLAALGLANTKRWPRRRGLALGAAASLVLLVDAGAQAAARRFSRELRVTFLAVGQGDAAVIELPGGGAMLVDAGGELGSTWDPGARVVLPFLWERGVRRLDVAVASHPHADHVLGLGAVLDALPVGELWDNGVVDKLGLAEALRARARARGTAVRPIDTRYTILSGGVSVDAIRAIDDGTLSENGQSIALRLAYGDVALLLAGDLEAEAEQRLVDAGAPLSAALVKAPHHGSRTSSTDAFVHAVAPHHVVFCVGAHNRFGFPHPDVLERWRAAGCTLWRTDEGAVTARTDGRTLTVERAR